jgi:hypothetical protein
MHRRYKEPSVAQRHRAASRRNESRAYQSRRSAASDIVLSVFRKVEFTELADAMNVFQNETRQPHSKVLGQNHEKPLASALLYMFESSVNSRLMGGVDSRALSNEIYNGVPDLRKKIRNVGIASVELFGAKENPIRQLGVTFDEDATIQLRGEREAIIDTFEAQSDSPSEDFEWMISVLPHVSLGNIDTRVHGRKVSRLIYSLTRAMPESIILNQATIHTPLA